MLLNAPLLALIGSRGISSLLCQRRAKAERGAVVCFDFDERGKKTRRRRRRQRCLCRKRSRLFGSSDHCLGVVSEAPARGVKDVGDEAAAERKEREGASTCRRTRPAPSPPSNVSFTVSSHFFLFHHAAPLPFFPMHSAATTCAMKGKAGERKSK